MAGPLDGLVVLDISRVIPGSIAGMLLADHGAEVIKIEPPGGAFFAGDLTRKSLERGKLSVTLDVGEEEDRRKVRELAARADILLHSFSREDAKALGLDRETLAHDNPGLIVCALSAYGDTPLSGRPYGESLAAARLGLMSTLTTPLREGPVYLGHPALHYGQAFVAVIGALAALRARRLSGVGQSVDASLLDGAAALSVMHWWQEGGQSFMTTADRSSPMRFGRTRIVSSMYQASDGQYLYLNTSGGTGFKQLMDIVGFGDRIKAIAGPEFAAPLDDDEYQAARFELDDAFKKRPRDEWIDLLHAADIAALPVLAPAEVLLDEQVTATGHVIELADPDYGTIKQGAPAFRFRGSPASAPKPAPRLGEHNSVLSDLLGRPIRAPTQVHPHSVTAPLQGVRIVDLGVFFACSFAARLLSDLGADVVKIESLEGDQMRPLPDLYDGAQRGKRNIAINLKTGEGREVAQKLIGQADIVLHNLRPGNAEKLGFAADEMMAANPQLIYAYMPGYGSSGPKAKLKSFAPLLSAWTGVMYEGGGEGNPPARSAVGNEDVYNGLLGAIGLLMALEARERTRFGDYFECPQLHSSIFTTAMHFLDASDNCVYGMRLDSEQCGFSALDRIYPAKDGWVCVCCRDDASFAALAQAIGQPRLPSDSRFADPVSRAAHDGELLAILKPFFSSRTKQAAQAALDAAGAPAEIVSEQNWMNEMLHQPWAQQSGRVFEDRNSIKGHIKVIGQVAQLDGTPGVRKGPAARLGEHTEAILKEFGYAPADIARMKEVRAVAAAGGSAT